MKTTSPIHVQYLGTYVADRIVYTLNLYRITPDFRTGGGVYHCCMHRVLPDGRLDASIAVRIYLSDTEAIEQELKFMEAYIVGLGIDLDDVAVVHPCGPFPTEPLPTDDELQAKSWADAQSAIERAAK